MQRSFIEYFFRSFHGHLHSHRMARSPMSSTSSVSMTLSIIIIFLIYVLVRVRKLLFYFLKFLLFDLFHSLMLQHCMYFDLLLLVRDMVSEMIILKMHILLCRLEFLLTFKKDNKTNWKNICIFSKKYCVFCLLHLSIECLSICSADLRKWKCIPKERFDSCFFLGLLLKQQVFLINSFIIEEFILMEYLINVHSYKEVTHEYSIEGKDQNMIAVKYESKIEELALFREKLIE